MNRRGFFGRALGGFVAAVVPQTKLLARVCPVEVGPVTFKARMPYNQEIVPMYLSVPWPRHDVTIVDLSDTTLAGD